MIGCGLCGRACNQRNEGYEEAERSKHVGSREEPTS
jgi:hypothetical protein